MASAEELAFLSRIRERPDDDGPRLIFADWLDERGDVRGEFIRVQCALDLIPFDDPRRIDLEDRERALQDQHSRKWTAKLRGLSSGWTYRRGFIEFISVDAAAFIERGIEIFRFGPIRRVRFVDASKCFAALVDCPNLARIREVDLCGNTLGNGGMSQLARSKHLMDLEFLHLGLNELTDQGLRTLASMPQLANLRELHLDDNRQIGSPGLRALADSPYMTSLRLLDVGGNGLNERSLKVLINGESLKRLDSLVLAGNEIADGGVEALARSDLLKRMIARSPALDLRQNNIGPMGARALAESPAVAPLEELNLDANAIGDAGLASLAQSPHLNLKRLIVSNNRIGDPGVLALTRSRLAETLEHLNLKGNFITADSVHLVDEASKALDWRKKIHIEHDAGLHLRGLHYRG